MAKIEGIVKGGTSKPPPEEPSFVDAMKSAVGAVDRAATPPAAAPKVESLLATLKRGKEFAPPRVLLFGQEGLGKSTFAAGAPNTVFIDVEQGLGRIDCVKFPVVTAWLDVQRQLTALAVEKHDFQTVAVDTVDALERLIQAQVCIDEGKPSIEKIGFARGHIFALEYWRELLKGLDRLRTERGMAVVLIAHSKSEKFEDPTTATYDRWSPRLNKHATALLTEWADAVLFAAWRFTIRKDGEGTDARSIATPIGNERVLKTVGNPALIAKNRYNLPPELPLSWTEFQNNLMKGM